jgi:hypothetical protein
MNNYYDSVGGDVGAEMRALVRDKSRQNADGTLKPFTVAPEGMERQSSGGKGSLEVLNQKVEEYNAAKREANRLGVTDSDVAEQSRAMRKYTEDAARDVKEARQTAEKNAEQRNDARRQEYAAYLESDDGSKLKTSIKKLLTDRITFVKTGVIEASRNTTLIETAGPEEAKHLARSLEKAGFLPSVHGSAVTLEVEPAKLPGQTRQGLERHKFNASLPQLDYGQLEKKLAAIVQNTPAPESEARGTRPAKVPEPAGRSPVVEPPAGPDPAAKARVVVPRPADRNKPPVSQAPPAQQPRENPSLKEPVKPAPGVPRNASPPGTSNFVASPAAASTPAAPLPDTVTPAPKVGVLQRGGQGSGALGGGLQVKTGIERIMNGEVVRGGVDIAVGGGSTADALGAFKQPPPGSGMLAGVGNKLGAVGGVLQAIDATEEYMRLRDQGKSWMDASGQASFGAGTGHLSAGMITKESAGAYMDGYGRGVERITHTALQAASGNLSWSEINEQIVKAHIDLEIAKQGLIWHSTPSKLVVNTLTLGDDLSDLAAASKFAPRERVVEAREATGGAALDKRLASMDGYTNLQASLSRLQAAGLLPAGARGDLAQIEAALKLARGNAQVDSFMPPTLDNPFGPLRSWTSSALLNTENQDAKENGRVLEAGWQEFARYKDDLAAAKYLADNPDVKAALESGSNTDDYKTAKEHYEKYGKAEGRAWTTDAAELSKLLPQPAPAVGTGDYRFIAEARPAKEGDAHLAILRSDAAPDTEITAHLRKDENGQDVVYQLELRGRDGTAGRIIPLESPMPVTLTANTSREELAQLATQAVAKDKQPATTAVPAAAAPVRPPVPDSVAADTPGGFAGFATAIMDEARQQGMTPESTQASDAGKPDAPPADDTPAMVQPDPSPVSAESPGGFFGFATAIMDEARQQGMTPEGQESVVVPIPDDTAGQRAGDLDVNPSSVQPALPVVEGQALPTSMETPAIQVTEREGVTADVGLATLMPAQAGPPVEIVTRRDGEDTKPVAENPLQRSGGLAEDGFTVRSFGKDDSASVTFSVSKGEWDRQLAGREDSPRDGFTVGSPGSRQDTASVTRSILSEERKLTLGDGGEASGDKFTLKPPVFADKSKTLLLKPDEMQKLMRESLQKYPRDTLVTTRDEHDEISSGGRGQPLSERPLTQGNRVWETTPDVFVTAKADPGQFLSGNQQGLRIDPPQSPDTAKPEKMLAKVEIKGSKSISGDELNDIGKMLKSLGVAKAEMSDTATSPVAGVKGVGKGDTVAKR